MFALVAAGSGLACVAPVAGWDVTALETRYPVLAEWSGHRLGDATPYFAPVPDGLALFLCRWPSDREIPLSLPKDATEDELAALRAALAAWQQAGIGVRFEEVPRERARIAIRFVGTDVRDRRPGGSATTSADCRLPAVSREYKSGEPLAVELVRAELILNRNNTDVLGRAVPLSQEELASTLLHELGHALGYPSHAAGGPSVMVHSIDQVRRLGRRVVAKRGGGFSAPTLGALYAIPSGTVVGRVLIGAEEMEPIWRLHEIARREGWGVPFARVGDRFARLWWVDDRGRIVGFLIPGIERGWKPELTWVPTRAALEVLSR